MNSFLFVISYLSIAVWLIPPFRQYKTPYFLYFLILALSDPLNITSFYIFHSGIWTGNVLASCFSVIALLKLQKIKRNIIPLTIYVAVIFFLLISINMNGMRILTALNLFLILLFFANDFVVSLKNNVSINLFYIVIILYNMANFTKIIFSLSYAKNRFLYFSATTFFQIFIAVYFSFCNVKNSKQLLLFGKETV